MEHPIFLIGSAVDRCILAIPNEFGTFTPRCVPRWAALSGPVPAWLETIRFVVAITQQYEWNAQERHGGASHRGWQELTDVHGCHRRRRLPCPD
jgi:hypothetical protein